MMPTGNNSAFDYNAAELALHVWVFPPQQLKLGIPLMNSQDTMK